MKYVIVSLLFFTTAVTAQTNFKLHHPCSFEISLPTEFSFTDLYPDNDNLDICDYVAKLKDGTQILTVSSTIQSRISLANIEESYQKAITDNEEIDITYKVQKGSWFIVSGKQKTTGKIVYWKRSWGELFVSDLYFEYDESIKKTVETHLSAIVKSFKAD